jgi:hypothetical protein
MPSDQSVPGGSFAALFFDSKRFESNEFDNPFTYSFSSSGILHEGDLVSVRQFIQIHTASFYEEFFGTGSGEGSWSLKLTPLNVPDTGSTLLMLGLALGGLWFGMCVPRQS